MIEILMWLVLLCAPVAMYGALCAVHAIDPKAVPGAISAGFVLVSVGWGAIVLAAIDYLVHRDPVAWPAVLMLGLAALAVGNAGIYLGNRRRCTCVGCPGRGSRAASPDRMVRHGP